MALDYFVQYDMGICDCQDTSKLVFIDGLDYWEAIIDQPDTEELILNFNEFLEEND